MKGQNMNVEAVRKFRAELVEQQARALLVVDQFLEVFAGVRVGPGTEVRGQRSEVRGDHLTPAPLPQRRGRKPKVKVSGAEQMAGRSELSDVLRECWAGLKAGWSRKELTEVLEWKHPEFAGEKFRMRTSSSLLYFLQKGTLTRTGQGHEARYTVAAAGSGRGSGGKKMSEMEREWSEARAKIHVPREAEVEAS